MKYIVLVGDGMGDFPIAELDNRTPLEAAATPAMDRIAAQGQMLRLRTVPNGYPPGSDVANLSLLGYRPEEVYKGRAPLEAASMNIELGAGEIAFRCNLVTTENGDDGQVIMRDYSAGHISTAEAHALITSLAEELNSDSISFYPGISYRHLMVRPGDTGGLKTVPPHDYTDKDVTSFVEEYRAIPELFELRQRAAQILKDHPVNIDRAAKGLNQANAIWLWGEGAAPAMPSMADQYGLTGTLISAVDLLKGIGVYAGMEIINVPGATGYLDTNYQGKAEAAIKALEDKDLVFVHVEAPDEAGHQGLLKEKLQAIEDFDKYIVKPIFEAAGKYDFRLALTMDHYTPLSLRTHVAEPVPIAIYDSRQLANGSATGYNEKSACEAPLLTDGQRFFDFLLERNSGA